MQGAHHVLLNIFSTPSGERKGRVDRREGSGKRSRVRVLFVPECYHYRKPPPMICIETLSIGASQKRSANTKPAINVTSRSCSYTRTLLHKHMMSSIGICGNWYLLSFSGLMESRRLQFLWWVGRTWSPCITMAVST